MYRCPFCSSIHTSLAKLKCHFIKAHLPLKKCPACGWASKRSRKDTRKAITSHIRHIVGRPNDYEYEFWLRHVAWAYLYFRYSHTGGRIRRDRLRLYKKVALDYFSLTRSCQERLQTPCAHQHQVPSMECPNCGTEIPVIRLKHVGLGSFVLICFNCATVLGKDLVKGPIGGAISCFLAPGHTPGGRLHPADPVGKEGGDLVCVGRMNYSRK